MPRARSQFDSGHCAIITDIDSINSNDSNKACRVSEGDRTSNSCLKDWFKKPAITPAELIAKGQPDKVRGIRRLAYQIPETTNGPCGRTFEDAFILANPTAFNVPLGTNVERETFAANEAEKNKKSDFALKYAITQQNWNVPKYIREALEWLTEPPPANPAVAAADTVCAAPSTPEPESGEAAE